MIIAVLRCAVTGVLMMFGTAVLAFAQVELLPLDHPATAALVRIYEYGAIPEFPREQLPVSRGLALRFLREAAADTLLPSALRQQAEYYRVELATDQGTTPTEVFIPTGDDSDSHLIYADPFEGFPVAVLQYRNTTRGLHVVLEGLADGELRIDPTESVRAMIFQWGFQLRGTLLDRVGFSSRITNGTVVGDSLLVLRDPKFRTSGKFGVIGIRRDVDFGFGHLRADFDLISAEIGRERIQLGAGGRSSLLVGSLLSSPYDYLRLTARVGRVSFTHLHASLLAGSDSGGAAGVVAAIPPKYLAAHIISFGPFAGIRGMIGESVVYSRRPFEIGYLNPMNFIKSQEHYLRDRDNTNMYAALSINPAAGIFLDGEFMLDDLRFSLIGDGYWGNKSAWRVGARATALPLTFIDVAVNYTRLEPYVFSHFEVANSYVHDGTGIAAGGINPNSDYLEATLRLVPVPNLTASASIGFERHGANITDSSGAVLRNVGGDIGRTHFPDDSLTVTFLDGRLEKTLRLRLEAEYEPIRNIYLRLVATHRQTETTLPVPDDTQVWFGIRLGVY